MSLSRFVPRSQQLSFKSLLETFKQVKSSFGLHYPSKHSVLQALSAALEKCDSKDLHIIAFQLDIEHKNLSDTKLRMDIQKHVFYKLYDASIKWWNVTVTSGITVIILLFIQKLLTNIGLGETILSPLSTLLSLAYFTIGIHALTVVFYRWMQSKNLRGKVLKLVDKLKSGSLRKSHLRHVSKGGGDKQSPPKYSPPRKRRSSPVGEGYSSPTGKRRSSPTGKRRSSLTRNRRSSLTRNRRSSLTRNRRSSLTRNRRSSPSPSPSPSPSRRRFTNSRRSLSTRKRSVDRRSSSGKR
jgi:hypothetical protein